MKNSIKLIGLTALLYAQMSYALPFLITTKSGTSLPGISFPNTTVPAYYTVTNNTSRVLVNSFVKYLPLNVQQNIFDTTYPDICGRQFTLQPRESCTLSLNVTGPVNVNDPDPRHHLFICLANGALCAGTSQPLNVLAASDKYLFNGFFYPFPIVDSLLTIAINPFIPFKDLEVKRCSPNVFISSSDPSLPNSISCRWGDFSSGPNMQLTIRTTQNIQSVRANCTFVPQAQSKITAVLCTKSGCLPFPDARPGRTGLNAKESWLPVASTILGILPSPNPTIVNQANNIQQIEATFPNYNTFLVSGGPIPAPTSQSNLVFVINNSDGSFDPDDTIHCTFTPQYAS